MEDSLPEGELRRLRSEVAPLFAGFDLLADHVVITDANGIIVYANKAVETNTGYSRAEVIGKNPGKLWGGQMPKEFYQKMWHAIGEKKEPFTGEVQNKRKDGTLYWQELHISPVFDKQGTVRFFIGVEPNITERKEKDKFRDDFASIMGHQLRTPLTTTKLFIELLLDDKTLTQEQRETIRQLEESNQMLIDLVSDLLTMVKIGSFTLRGEEFDLHDLLLSLIHSTGIKHPAIKIDFDAAAGKYPLFLNKVLVEQVFSNLISNAAEYAEKKEGFVLVTLEKRASGYFFSVENNGTIIPAGDQAHIFGRLFRASNAREAKTEGTGLGLYIVKMICDSFGWPVSFVSPRPSDAGAIFSVELVVTK